jgi:hypothetical protein
MCIPACVNQNDAKIFKVKMMIKIKFLTIVSILVLMTACGLPALSPVLPTPDLAQTVNAVRTEAALTVAAEMPALDTNTPEPPTASPEPTFTPLPSDTPQPTETPLPTLTLTNTATFTTTPTATRTATSSNPTPKITIMGVQKNKAVTVQTGNFPPNQVFTIRMGPLSGFSGNNKVTGTVYSGSGGTFLITTFIPGDYANVDKLTIRLDSNLGFYAFNAFENKDSGTVVYTATVVPTTKCEVSISPSLYTIFPPKADFDAAWTIKNTSDSAWDVAAVDYKHLSGTEMQKYEKLYDIPKTVEPGQSITIVVDMIAPDKAGTYSTNWALIKGSTVLCNLPVTIVVK